MKLNQHGLQILQKQTRRVNTKIFQKTGGYCYYCGFQLKILTFTVDHVIPKSKGGSDRNENLVPACQLCNTTKSNFYVEEFRDWLQIGLKQPICFFGENNGKEHLLIRPFIKAKNEAKKNAPKSCRFCGRPVTIADFNRSHLECGKAIFEQKLNEAQ